MMFDVDVFLLLWCPDNLLPPLPCLMLPKLCTRYQCYDTGTSRLRVLSRRVVVSSALISERGATLRHRDMGSEDTINIMRNKTRETKKPSVYVNRLYICKCKVE